MKKAHTFPLPEGALPFPHPQTPESAAALVRQEGICISELARATGIQRYTFIGLLAGRQKGLRGNAHRAAVLLGLKPPPRRRAAQKGAAA